MAPRVVVIYLINPSTWRQVLKLRFLPLLLILFLAACGNDNTTTNDTPVITGISPTQVFLGQNNVQGRISGQNLTGVTTVDLGPGITVITAESLSATEVRVVFSVASNAQPGTHTITVTTSRGTVTNAAIFQVINNHVPRAAFKIIGSLSRTSVITFDASTSSDPDGPVRTYSWDFGDGTTGRGKIVTHTYAQTGNYTVTLTVSDNQATTTSSKQIHIINNTPPVALFDVSPNDGLSGTEFTFDASTSRDRESTITYEWDFGDGKKGEGKIVKHSYNDAGTYKVTLTVTDAANATDTIEATVKVSSGGGGGGGGGSCALNDFRSNQFNVLSVSGNTITADKAFRKCPACGEIRRPRGDGIREFVGNVTRIDGNRITFDPKGLPASTRPHAGERLVLVWKPSHECRR